MFFNKLKYNNIDICNRYTVYIKDINLLIRNKNAFGYSKWKIVLSLHYKKLETTKN